MKQQENISVLLKDNSSNVLIADSSTLLKENGFVDEQISQFADDAVGILNDYAELIGEGTQISYILLKRLARIELVVKIPGEEFDPFKNGSGALERTFRNLVSLNLNTETVRVSHKYLFGNNVITVSFPLVEKRRKLLKDPMILAIVSGIVLGHICQHLPSDVNSFIINDLASPIMSIILKVISGIMGPVIFLSMTTSIIALDNINDLTNLGFRIIRRFILIILFMTAVSIGVSAVFFRSFGTGSISIAPSQLIRMLLDIIPVNLIEPFLSNNTPQLVILGLLLGSALLMLGDTVSDLNNLLMQINEWIMSAMRIILMVSPIIPFLSIFTSVAKGNIGEMASGWKFILASYIAFSLCTIIKLIKTSFTTGISVPELWKRIKPVVMMALTTGSTSTPLRKVHEISVNEFHIKPEFSSFWIPMSSAMLSPKTTINVVIATFMVAEMTGIAVTTSFLIVLSLVTLELSIASPGTTSAWTIMFETLSMPTGYVGLFTIYRMLTNNFSAACTEAYSMLEEVEAAYKLDGLSSEHSA